MRSRRRGALGGFNLNYNKNLISRAKELRKEMTPQERHLWYDFLRYYPIKIYKQKVIDNFIEIILPNTHSEILNVVFKEDIYQHTWMFKIKRILGIKTQSYYSLKEVNDLVIKSIVIYYRYHQFTYSVSSDLKSINLKIVK